MNIKALTQLIGGLANIENVVSWAQQTLLLLLNQVKQPFLTSS